MTKISIITNPNGIGAWGHETTTYDFDGPASLLTESDIRACLSCHKTTTKSGERVANAITRVKFSNPTYARREDGAEVLMAGYGYYPDGGVETFHVVVAD